MTVANPGSPTQGEKATRFSREKLAWTVLLAAFAVFLILAISIPLSVNWAVQNLTVSQFASIQGTDGNTLIEQANVPDPVAIEAGKSKEDVAEGSVIRADSSTQAFVVLFDRSTLTVFPNSTVTLSEMRRPRFGRSERPNHVVIKVHSGRVRVQVAATEGQEMTFQVQTPQALAPVGGINLEPGNYAIEVTNEVSHISVRTGQAEVRGQTGQSATLQANERAEIPLGAAAVGPLPGKRNLLVNGTFENPEYAVPISNGQLVPGWLAVSEQGGDGGNVDGTVDVEILGVTRAVHFQRQNSGNNHGETGILQQLNKLVGDYTSLILRLDVQIVAQSLSGGGEQSTEFPLIVRVDYEDQYGDKQHWIQGFYCQNSAGYNILNGQELPCQTRRAIEIDLQQELNQPRRINSLKLYASGWDWDVYLSDVELIAEDS